MLTFATFSYLVCFAGAAFPAIVRLYRRKSSADCSCWRELLILTGVCIQFGVFVAVGVRDWQVLISPVMSFLSVSMLLGMIWRYRK
jgi:hypothetical protein